MARWLRSFLYSKRFFGLLVLISLIDLGTDLTEHIHPHYWDLANAISIVLDCVLLSLAGWMYLDLQLRKPK